MPRVCCFVKQAGSEASKLLLRPSIQPIPGMGIKAYCSAYANAMMAFLPGHSSAGGGPGPAVKKVGLERFFPPFIRPRRLASTSTLTLSLSPLLALFIQSSSVQIFFRRQFPQISWISVVLLPVFAFGAQDSLTGLGELLLRRPAAAVDAFSTIRHRCLQKPLVLRTARHFSGVGRTAMARREVCRGKTEFRESLARALWPAGARVNAEMKRFR